MGAEDARVEAGYPAAGAGKLTIGRDLLVNRMGLGTAQITGPGVWGDPADREESKAVLRSALALGVTLIDTADCYGPEVSELLIAEALHPYPEGLVIATKGGRKIVSPGCWAPAGRPAQLRKACEGSMRRLRLERIPLYQLHRPDPDVPVTESFGALAELQDEGKIQHIGGSNMSLAQLDEALTVAPVVSMQNRFSVGDQSSLDILKRCQRERMAFLPWAPLAGAENPAVREVARRRGISTRQVALAWLLALSGQVVAIPGTGSVSHLKENVSAAGIKLSPAEVTMLSVAASGAVSADVPLAEAGHMPDVRSG